MPAPPTIYINGRFLTQRTTGVQRYAQGLLTALDDVLSAGRLHDYRFVLVVPPGARSKPALKTIAYQQRGRLRGHAWEQLELPWISQNGWLINFCNTGPMFKRRQLVVIHDAAVAAMPAAYAPPFRLIYRRMYAAFRRLGVRIVTVSEFSRHELARHFAFDAQAVRVVYPGFDHAHAQYDWPTAWGLRPHEYALFVGSLQANKNLAALLAAFGKAHPPGFDIVIAGSFTAGVFHSALPTSRLPPWFKVLGYVTDAQLCALYTNAGCFVFPSLYEGFGLPPIEAMLHGCPVAVAMAASLPEVCQDAAAYFDPRDPTSLRQTLTNLMTRPAMRQGIREAWYRRAANFRWRDAAATLCTIVEDALQSRTDGRVRKRMHKPVA